MKAVNRALTAEMRVEHFMECAATAEKRVLAQCAFDGLKLFAESMLFRSTCVDSFDQSIARRITGEAFRGWWSVRRDDSEIMEVKAVAVQEVQDQSERVAELEREVLRWQTLQRRDVQKDQKNNSCVGSLSSDGIVVVVVVLLGILGK